MSYTNILALASISLLLCLVLYFIKPLMSFYLIIGIRILAEAATTMGYAEHATSILGSYGLFIILLSMFLALFTRRFKIFANPIKPYFLFLFLCLLSLGFTEDMFGAAKMLLKLCCLPAIFLIAYNSINSEEKVLKSLKYLSYTALAPLAVGFYQLASGTGMTSTNFWGQSQYKIYSTFAHPNQYAFFLAMIAFALIVLIQQSTTNRLYIFSLLALTAISILFTFSRSVWLGLAICIAIISFYYKKLRIPVAIIAFGFFLLLTPLIVQGTADIFDKQKGQENSIDFRINMTTELLQNAFPKRPILGFGPGSSEAVVNKYTQYGFIVPHNDYMRILIEFGLIGFMGFLGFLGVNFLFIIKNLRKLGNNNYFTSIFIMLLFLSGILVGTNHIGNISTSGIWFLLYGILFKGFELSEKNAS